MQFFVNKITSCYETITLIKLTLVYDEPNLEGNELLVITKAKDKFVFCYAKNWN